MEHNINTILNKLSAASATEDDWNELLEAIRNDHTGEIIAAIEQHENRHAHTLAFNPESPEWDTVFNNAVAADRPAQSIKINTGKLSRIRILRLSAVAALLVLSLLSVLYFLLPESKGTTENKKQITTIMPGVQGAILTLADGKQVVLDTAKNGLIAAQNGSEILVNDGTMSYRPQETNKDLVEYNTMTTPKGRQFEFTLPDGTKVWLNAASSIKYPTNFKGKTRKVDITGEAFFEVTPNIHQPFIVKAGNDAGIEVLGTSFNVNAYANEHNIRTTLVSGLVKVENISGNLPPAVNKEVLLKPGQQAIVALTSRLSKESISNKLQAISIEQEVNVDKIIAWKKGIFNFEGSSLVEVMKELERWYDVEVVYEGTPPAMKFYGKMEKSSAE